MAKALEIPSAEEPGSDATDSVGLLLSNDSADRLARGCDVSGDGATPPNEEGRVVF